MTRDQEGMALILSNAGYITEQIAAHLKLPPTDIQLATTGKGKHRDTKVIKLIEELVYEAKHLKAVV